MLLTYYMWIKAVKTGSVYWSSMCALAYFYMVRMNLCFSSEPECSEVNMVSVCPGFLLGWLRVPDQPHPPPCPGADAHRSFLSPYICGLLHRLLPGHYSVHADLFCWFPGRKKATLHQKKMTFLGHLLIFLSFLLNTPASTVVGAHGSFWCVWLVSDSRLCGLPAQQTQYPAV